MRQTAPIRPARTTCRHCGSSRVTALSMTLTDGSRVDFSSCRHCEGKSWSADGAALPLSSVLERARRR